MDYKQRRKGLEEFNESQLFLARWNTGHKHATSSLRKDIFQQTTLSDIQFIKTKIICKKTTCRLKNIPSRQRTLPTGIALTQAIKPIQPHVIVQVQFDWEI